MKAFWVVFELIVNLYQGFIAMYFVYSYLSDKKSAGFLRGTGMLFTVIYATVVSILNVTTSVFEHFYALIYVLIVLAYALTSLKGSIFRKLFASSFSVGIQLVSTALVGVLATVLFGENLSTIFTVNNSYRLISIIAVQLMILYFVFISLKLLKKNNIENHDLTFIEWLLILAVLGISIIMGTMLVLLSIPSYSVNSNIYTVLIFVGIIVINIVVCYLVIDLGKKNEIARENEALKLSQEYNQQYVDNATAEYDTIKKLQHDFKNNYSTVHALISNGDADAALSHIESNVELLETFAVYVKSENPIVNAVINAKFSEAKPFGIDCSCICSTDFRYIDNLDLCRLLSNLLENAVTACKKVDIDKPSIILSLSNDENSYMIALKNSISSSVLKVNPHLLTTKSDRSEHGHGINIIKSIASKYDGFCDFYEENDMFCCKVILNKLFDKADYE